MQKRQVHIHEATSILLEGSMCRYIRQIANQKHSILPQGKRPNHQAQIASLMAHYPFDRKDRALHINPKQLSFNDNLSLL